MDIRQHVVDDLRLRATLLPMELSGWRELAADNVDAMGIHLSQAEAIEVELSGLDAKQRQALAALDAAQPATEVAAGRFRAERELSALHGIASIFRNAFLQRQGEPSFGRALRAADLITAECYRHVIEQAEGWGAITAGRFRPPPLAFLNALSGPAAFTRGHTFGVFKVPLDAYSELKLPISLVSLPFHYTAGVWTYCSLYHEVGHPLDQDLELSGALKEPLAARLIVDGVAADQVDVWKRWLRETVADAFGVLFGGEAFAWSLIDTIFQSTNEVTKLNAQDTHPNAYVRVFLLGALLRQADAALFTPTADAIEAYWKEVYGEPEAPGAFRGACGAVATVVLEEPLPCLGGHRLRELAPNLGGDRALTKDLATFLALDLFRPDPDRFPVRLVPAAARLAARIEPGAPPDLSGIQHRALDYIDAIPQPMFLGGAEAAPADRTEYLRELVAAADLSTLLDEDDGP